MSVASYPHTDIHVKDNSIFTAVAQSTLPLHKPLWMMKTEKGDPGVAVWCPTFGHAKKNFGAGTFNEQTDYFSNQAYFLLNTLTAGGAFIMRVADANAKAAEISIEIGLKECNVPQYQRDVNGRFITEYDGSKVKIDTDGKAIVYESVPKYKATEDTTAIRGKTYYTRTGEEGSYTYTVAKVAVGTALEASTYFEYEGESLVPSSTKDQATIAGYKVAWRAVVGAINQDYEDGTTHQSTDGFTWYPVMNIVAKNVGAWGQHYGLKLYFNAGENTVANTIKNGAITISASPVELEEGETTPAAIADAFGETITTGVMKKGVIDEVTGLDLGLAKRLADKYTGEHKLPVDIYMIGENFAKVGALIMKKEIAARAAAQALYASTYGIDTESEDLLTFVDVLKEKTGAIDGEDHDVATTADIKEADGYMANVLSCMSSDKIPYYSAVIASESDKDVEAEVTESSKVGAEGVGIFVPGADVAVYLGGGEDGATDDASVESHIRASIKSAEAGTHEFLNDPWRIPYNSIMDTGVSLKTKKAYLDMLNVRDSLMVNLSTQVTWALADGSFPELNSRYEDESIGSVLRSYALLQKEDVENGTEACRCKIFLTSGRRSDYSRGNGWIPMTFFIAMKNAQYLNTQIIKKEVKELPNSQIDCFNEVSWVAFSEDTKARCWNAGLNYPQYYDYSTSNDTIHFASIRTVYRYDSSVLCDGSFVDAICFTKEIVRRSWSTWAGSTRKAAELNKLIEDDLKGRIGRMLNNKYTLENVSVYQTDEDLKFGFVRHVDISLRSPAQNRVWKVTIECNREGFEPEEA